MSEPIRDLLRAFRRGEIEEEQMVQRIVRQPFEEYMIGRFDQNRQERTGIPEVILAEGKSPAAVAEIFADYLERDEQLIATRVTPEILEALGPNLSRLHHIAEAHIVVANLLFLEELI